MGVGIAFTYGPLLIALFFVSLRFSRRSSQEREVQDPTYKAKLWQLAVGFLLSSLVTVFTSYLLLTHGSKETMATVVWLLAPNVIVPFLLSFIFKMASSATQKNGQESSQNSNRYINYAIGAINSVWLLPAVLLFVLDQLHSHSLI